MSDMNRKRSLLTGSMGLLVAIMVVNAMNYGLNVFLANVLDPALFGDISLMVTFLLIAGVLASTLQLATSVAILSEDGDSSSVAPAMRLFTNRIGIVSGIALIAAAPLLAQILRVGSPWAVLIMGLGLPLHLHVAVERGRLQGEMQLAKMSATFLAEAMARLGATILAVALFPCLTSLTIALNAGFVGAYLVCRPCRGRLSWFDLSPSHGRPPIRSVGATIVAASNPTIRNRFKNQFVP